ncbi:MAG: Ppx/GppA family phosphatase [Synergistaceae bacterium]|jgi:exopolyphosphatase/guanosine-5'-triphosphate,3'-diphosphate pyrophosphatase|nr:Ppx/GppA family phosphatase [Synergistaceae bacterium]
MDGDGIRAVMDVGTNSIKLLVAACSSGKQTVLADRTEITRLGEGAEETGELSRAAMERTAGAIDGMARNALALGAGEITAVGSHAMRAARNAGDFIRFVKSACGVNIRVISGEEEAETAFLAAAEAIPGYAGERTVLDVGGGSSELVCGSPERLTRCFSIPVGALSLYGKFFHEIPRGGPVGSGILDETRRFVRNAAENSGFSERSGAIPCVGVGGTVVTLASVFLGLGASGTGLTDGSILTVFEIERQIALFASMNTEERKKIRGMIPERADIALPGACAVIALMDFCGVKGLTVSGKGLRHGLMSKIAQARRGDPAGDRR